MSANKKAMKCAEVFIDKGTKFYVGNTETKRKACLNKHFP